MTSLESVMEYVKKNTDNKKYTDGVSSLWGIPGVF